MSVIDIIIYAADYLFQNAILPYLPDTSGDLTLTTFQTYLDGFKTLVTQGYSGLGFIAPMGLVLLLIKIVIAAEITLFGFTLLMKGLKWAHIIG
jgi:hypothetical protein